MTIRRFARKTPEHDLQKAVGQYLNATLPVESWWTSIDHAGGGILAGALRKARHVKAGIPDILIVWYGRAYFIELKAGPGRLSSDQWTAMGAIGKAGGRTGVAWRLEDVEELLRHWNIPLRARLSEPASVKAARETA